MEAILIALSALTFLNVGLSIFGGFTFGYIFKDIPLDRKTIFISILFVLAFSLGRIIFVATAGSGVGLAGTTLFLIYLAAALIARKIFRRE